MSAPLDYRAIAGLALPFMLNSAVQAVLNATDTWFIGRLSPGATAAMGAVYWPVLVCLLLLGGVSLSVQTVVAQAYGGRRRARAAQATWTALWAAAATLPLFGLLALSGGRMFAPFGLPATTLALALDYWRPRMLGAPLGLALWAVLGFFNGIGRPVVTLRISVAVAVVNALLNQLLVLDWGLGVAGSAWATNAAQSLGLGAALMAFLGAPQLAAYRTRLTWRPRNRPLAQQLRLGIPIGVLSAADILGFALFQLMQVRLGVVDGAATQIVMMLTSFCYMPAVGIAMAGTTLVGQAIGARRPRRAARVGGGIIGRTGGYMGVGGGWRAALGRWLVPLFTNPDDPQAAAVAARGALLLWIAAGYQIFDGLNIGASACLRGAGDVRLPAIMVIALSWFCFVPLAHTLSFAPGDGWVTGLPQLGWGAVGGWLAALAYVFALGLALFLRWRSGAWRFHAVAGEENIACF